MAEFELTPLVEVGLGRLYGGALAAVEIHDLEGIALIGAGE